MGNFNEKLEPTCLRDLWLEAALAVLVFDCCRRAMPGSLRDEAPAGVCDVVLDWDAVVMGRLAELPSAGFGRARFRGLILRVARKPLALSVVLEARF